MKRDYSLETLAIQGGFSPEDGESRVAPIIQSTTFQYHSAEKVANLFALEEEGYFYTRLANPTVGFAEEKLATLEGGVGAIGTSSGQAATSLVVFTLCQAGDRILAHSNLYGGTMNLFTHTLKRLGIETDFVNIDATDEEIEALITDKHKLFFTETLANPGLEISDIERFSKIAHDHEMPLVVDNTFATPYLCRPFDFGADIIIHSSSKYLDGHAVALGGFVVDSGNFDWEKSSKFKDFVEPDPTYNDISFTETFGNSAFILRARTNYMRDYGVMMSPMNGWLTNLGMETLAVRMDRHSENALKIAEFLEGEEKIQSLKYPGLKSSPYYDLAQKYLPKGQSGVISFSFESREKAQEFIDGLELISLVVHVADVRSHILHPASMTHSQLTEKELEEAGIDPGLVRLSVGIEKVEDILDDIKKALGNI